MCMCAAIRVPEVADDSYDDVGNFSQVGYVPAAPMIRLPWSCLETIRRCSLFNKNGLSSVPICLWSRS